jgi:8-oxo-dGTP diphosphatase
MVHKTLVFLWKPSEKKVLLARKKRGFGVGKWNGVGGKVEKGETIEQATVRETYEEIGVRCHESALVKCGEQTFRYEANPLWDCVVHVFMVTDWQGEPTESEEMSPTWYSVDTLPFKEMWEDDGYWVPRVLCGLCVRDSYVFGADGTVAKKEIVNTECFGAPRFSD